MFDQMKQLKDLASMLGNPQEMKAKFERIQEELAEKETSAEAGAGAVRVTVNGRMEVVQVRLDPAMVSTLAGEGAEADREMIEELIRSATNAALERAQEMAREELSRLSGGMNLPGMDQLLGGGGGSQGT